MIIDPLPGKESGGPPLPHTAHRRRWPAVAAVAAVVIAVAATIVVIVNQDEKPGTPSGAATTVSAPVTAPPTTQADTGSAVTTVTTTGPAPTSTRPTAAVALDRFFMAAAALDRQLHAAATAINGTGPPWRQLGPEMAKKVRTADLAPVATAIPAGLPRGLLRSVVLVYSDLASRRFAMADFSTVTTIHPDATPNNDDLVQHLGNGHAAAVRFAGDLAAAHTLAGATDAVATPSSDSRQAAEVRLYTLLVEEANGGCDTRGGHLFTELPAIVWDGPGGGTIGAVRFTATLGADRTWQVRLVAC